MPSYYSFGEKSAALIGLLVSSAGFVKAFAYNRGPLNGGVLPAMDPVFVSDPLKLDKPGLVSFRLTLVKDKGVDPTTGAKLVREGLLSIEPLVWPKAYEVNRVHFLGMLNPFGTDEIPYHDLGGGNRQGIYDPNRVFDGTFLYNPAAVDPKQRAVVTLTDVESGGQSVETVSVSDFDSSAGPGGVLIAIRVNEANRGKPCAVLEFTGGHAVQVPDKAGVNQAQSKLVLNC